MPDMTTIHSFAPLFKENATVLILGSIPGKISLTKEQYYANTRNAFWKIMATLLGFNSSSTYEDRINSLYKKRIAVWDVLAMCTRESSLDSDIIESSIVPNDFNYLYNQLPDLTHIYFNGIKAEQSYQRHVYSLLHQNFQNITCLRLPSTSPAHATMNFQQKLAAWSVIVK